MPERERERETARNGVHSPFYGTRYRENTVIRYRYLPIPSSSTAPEAPELDDGIGYWIPVRGRRYRQIPVPDDGLDDGRRTLISTNQENLDVK